MRFDLADLSLFRHVVEAGSITHGAERANLALAAASTRIRNMEDALGAALLVRGRQGVQPTQAGRTLLQHARTILRQAERLREDLGAYAGGLAGQIRVLSNTNALTEFLPEALSSFLASHPHVSVDLEERLSDEIVGLIAEGVADIGIVAGTVDASALETYPFRRDRFVLVVARDHPLAKRSKIPFAQVLDHDFVGLDRASALQRFLADKAARDRPAAAAARAVAQLRRGLPPGRVQGRHRHRAGDDRAAGRAHHGDRHRRARRCLGGARAHHLHPAAGRAAALCAAAGGAPARGWLTSLQREHAAFASRCYTCGERRTAQQHGATEGGRYDDEIYIRYAALSCGVALAGVAGRGANRQGRRSRIRRAPMSAPSI